MPEIELKKIKPNRLNPRLEFRKVGLDELADSIEKSGIVEPLIVRPSGKDIYEVVVGERRYRAAQQAGLDKIPVIVQEYTDDEVIELNLIENIQREDLNEIEKGNCINELIARNPEKYPTPKAVANRIGVSDSEVYAWIKSTELPKQIQKMVAPPETLERGRIPRGKITADVARQIRRRIEEPERQIEVARSLAKEPVPWRAAREVVKEAARKPKIPVEKIIRKAKEIPPVLPFSKKHAEDILKRIKTQTARKAKDPRIIPGTIVRGQITHFANLKVTDVYRKKLGEFDEEDTKREGGYTLEEFKKVWKALHDEWDPDETVYVIRFELAKEI